MRKRNSEEPADWLRNAKDYLKNAKETSISYLKVLHIHESVERALKAAHIYLTRKPHPRTHSILYLIGELKKLEPDFEKFEEFCRRLEPYYGEKYPSIEGTIEVEENKIDSFLMQSSKLLAFVEELLRYEDGE